MEKSRTVVLLIDVEPDDRTPDGPNGGWSGAQASLPLFEDLRQKLAERTSRPVRFNWFLRMDPQIERIWGDPRYIAKALPRLFEDAARHGDGLGIHPHLWRWHDTHRTWFNDFASDHWAKECFRVSFQAFQDVVGEPAKACRFGDHFLSETAVAEMEAAGIQADLTLEPGLPTEPAYEDPFATACLPDFRIAPAEPYRPAPGDYLRPGTGAGARNIWMLPLTMTEPYWRRIRRRPWITKAPQSPNLVLPSRIMAPFLKRAVHSQPLLVLAVRAGDLATNINRTHFLQNMESLITAPEITNCEFTDPETALRLSVSAV
jgi:hypothetical protein